MTYWLRLPDEQASIRRTGRAADAWYEAPAAYPRRPASGWRRCRRISCAALLDSSTWRVGTGHATRALIARRATDCRSAARSLRRPTVSVERLSVTRSGHQGPRATRPGTRAVRAGDAGHRVSAASSRGTVRARRTNLDGDRPPDVAVLTRGWQWHEGALAGPCCGEPNPRQGRQRWLHRPRRSAGRQTEERNEGEVVRVDGQSAVVISVHPQWMRRTSWNCHRDGPVRISQRRRNR